MQVKSSTLILFSYFAYVYCFSVVPNTNEVATVLECDGVHIEQAGEYQIVGDGDREIPSESCSVVFLAEPDESIEITIIESYFNCTLDINSDYAILFDGVHVERSFFPPMSASADGRKRQFKTVCEDDPELRSVATYRTSTNALTVLHTLDNFDGVAMRFAIRFVRNPNPCNVIAMHSSGLFTMESTEVQAKNCSVLILQPAQIVFQSIAVGRSLPVTKTNAKKASIARRKSATNLLQSQISNGCASPSSQELLEIAPFPYRPGLLFCGISTGVLDDNQERRYAIDSCGPVTVRLQSSGQTENRVVFSWRESDANLAARPISKQCLRLHSMKLKNILKY